MDYFAYPISETEALRVPFPHDLPLEFREKYMRNPPQSALEKAERIPHDSRPPKEPVPPAPKAPAPNPAVLFAQYAPDTDEE